MKIDPLEKVRLNKRTEQAHARMMEGDREGAREIFKEILLQNPGYPAALHGVGVLNAEQGEVEEAERWLRQAIDADSDNALPWNDLGEVLRMLGRGDEAIAAYRRALELDPNFLSALNNLAVALAGKGDLDEAKRCLRQAIDCDPMDPHPYNNLGVILEIEGQIEEALHCYEKAVKFKHDFEEAKQNYADLLQRNPDKLLQAMGRLLDDAKSLD
jgi:Flp pilus assembly protein TadD